LEWQLVARNPFAQLDRLGDFVDSFARCFKRKDQAKVGATYVRGVLGDAARKNMQGMWKRCAEDIDYQSLQHFITHSSWSHEGVWSALRAKCPDRRGVLAIDDTGLPKKGSLSPGVQRQYSGTLGKVGNCQIIVSAVLRGEKGIWPVGMQLYLPDTWAEDAERRERAAIPEELQFQPKWQIALDLVDRAIESGIDIECVTADAAYGDNTKFRSEVRKRGLHYSVGIQGQCKVFLKPPRFVSRKSNMKGRPPTRLKLASNSPKPRSVKEIAEAMPDEEWVEVTWRDGSKGDLKAEFLAVRVTPSRGWHNGDENERGWLLCERPIGRDEGVRKYHFSSLPEDTSLEELVWVTHERWAIEHNYKQLKGELGMDHFEGRSYPGLHRHLALTSIAYYFLELERGRSRAVERPTLNQVRRILSEMFTMLYIANDPRARRMMQYLLRDPPSPT
jgi:SRSO17 transposase